MQVIGLTGGIGSGKSAVADRLRRLGVPVIDADQLAREVVRAGTAGYEAIGNRFGQRVLRPDGGLDRSALGKIVFGDSAEREALEEILHPLIRQRAEVAFDRYRSLEQPPPYVVYMAPLLFEAGGDLSRYDRIIVVDCPPEVAVDRVMKRDHLSSEEVALRMRAQLSRQARNAQADIILENSGTEAELDTRVSQLHQSLIS